MSLVKRPKMTEKKVAANERNRKLSHGPVTEEGRARIRAAHLRHGFYAQAEEVVLRDLGEDPAQFQELLEGLWKTYQPADAAQEGLVIHLTRETWQMNRADRMQEGCVARLAQEANSRRQDRLHAQAMRLKITEERFKRLVQRVARENFVTTPEDLEKVKNLHQEGVLKEMGEMVVDLFYELRPPGAGQDAVDPDEKNRKVLIRIKEIFGLNSDTPPGVKIAQASSPAPGSPLIVGAALPGPPDPSTVRCESDHRAPEIKDAGAAQSVKKEPRALSPEQAAREMARQLLENILTRQVESCKAQRQAVLKESVNGPSPYERAAEIAPTHPNALLMRRMQDSHFREVRRVTNLLLKLKRHQNKMEALKGNDQETPRSTEQAGGAL